MKRNSKILPLIATGFAILLVGSICLAEVKVTLDPFENGKVNSEENSGGGIQPAAKYVYQCKLKGSTANGFKLSIKLGGVATTLNDSVAGLYRTTGMNTGFTTNYSGTLSPRNNDTPVSPSTLQVSKAIETGAAQGSVVQDGTSYSCSKVSEGFPQP